MLFKEEDIHNLDRIKRLNIINSVTGIKPANLIGTISGEGHPNLAIFSSVVHLGSNPPLLGFIQRPESNVGRHTYENIKENGYYTINHVHEDFIESAHFTSAKFEKHESEFEACDLHEEYIEGFKTPFVKESRIKLGMKMEQEIPITINNTILVIGKVVLAIIEDSVMDEHGHMDLASLRNVGISGLNSYYALQKLAQFPYARPNELPDHLANKNKKSD